MNKVDFDEESSSFILSKDGITTPYQYIPSRKDIWEDMKDEDFDVHLLNNPFLHRESDYFDLFFDESEERGGVLFPVSLLESEEVHDRLLLSYMFITYYTLLTRINGEATGVLSDSYPDAFILVVHKKTKADFRIDDYVLSLAERGFYLYKGAVRGNFPSLSFFKTLPRSFSLTHSNDDCLNNSYVRDLIKNQLVKTSDFLTRFVLIYQVVELYISEIHYKLLDKTIEDYQNKVFSRNEFSEKLKVISKEAYQVECLAKEYSDETVCNEYNTEIKGLFNDIGYEPSNNSIATLLYSLRNQIFHNYGLFAGHENHLYEAIFRFERVILFFLKSKPLN